MGSITTRNLDDDVIARLKERAKRNNRSLEAELREIVGQAARRLSREEFVAEADRIAAMGPASIEADVDALLREDRDR